MNTRRTNLTLWATAAVLGCAAVGVLAAGVLLPPEADRANDAGVERQPRPASRPTAVAAGLPPLALFEPVWTARLRQPLPAVDPSAAAAAAKPTAARVAAPPVAPPPPPVALVGTIGDTVAILRVPDGSVEVRGVGEAVAGAVVVAIRRAEADLRYNGQIVTLRRDPDAPEQDPLQPSATRPPEPRSDPPAAADPPAPAEAADAGGP
jgi:hypothetical protein